MTLPKADHERYSSSLLLPFPFCLRGYPSPRHDSVQSLCVEEAHSVLSSVTKPAFSCQLTIAERLNTAARFGVSSSLLTDDPFEDITLALYMTLTFKNNIGCLFPSCNPSRSSLLKSTYLISHQRWSPHPVRFREVQHARDQRMPHEALSLIQRIKMKLVAFCVTPAVRPPFCCQGQIGGTRGQSRAGRR